MFRRMFTAVTLAAAVGGPGLAAEDTVALGRYKPDPGGFGGAVRSAAVAEIARGGADDTELVGHHGGFHGGYYGGYRGYYGGYRGYYGGFYRPYYGGYRSYYSGFYRPYFYGGFYRPYYYGYGYRPYYTGFYGLGLGYGWPYYGYSGLGFGFYRPGFSLWISGYPRYYGYGGGYGYPYVSYGYTSYSYSYPVGGVTTAVYNPVVTLAVNPTPSPSTTSPAPAMIPPATDGNGSYRYDGGPALPVPQPAPDDPGAKPTPPQETSAVPISFPPKPPAKKPAHKYPAYGEK